MNRSPVAPVLPVSDELRRERSQTWILRYRDMQLLAEAKGLLVEASTYERAWNMELDELAGLPTEA